MSAPPQEPLELLHRTLAGQRAWLVGGAVRDRLRGARGAPADAATLVTGAARVPATVARAGADYDVVLDGDPGAAARALAQAARSPRASAFALSEEYGGWRVVARGGAWQVDFERLRGATLAQDLALRDFTVNAIAEPLGEARADSSALIDPLGGAEDLARRRLRAAGPAAFADDPLRVLRLVRLMLELRLEPEPETLAAARTQAPRLSAVAAERVFMELRRILAAPGARAGLELLGELGAADAVLPELQALRGVEQSHYHHLDVYGHTLAVLEQTIALSTEIADASGAEDAGAGGGAVAEGGRGVAGAEAGELGALLGEHGAPLAALLAEPLADELTRGEALRWGALLHDIAKPATRAEVPDADRHVTFIGHDRLGAELAGEILTRLRVSARLRAHVAALVRQHLRLGFLVHEPQPLARRTVYDYLRACEPVAVDVTLLSVADRLATRGARAERAIAAHLGLARAVLGDALAWHAAGPPRALWRGDELARALQIEPGPRLGELLEALSAATYAGEVATREQALEHARGLLAVADRARSS